MQMAGYILTLKFSHFCICDNTICLQGPEQGYTHTHTRTAQGPEQGKTHTDTCAHTHARAHTHTHTHTHTHSDTDRWTNRHKGVQAVLHTVHILYKHNENSIA